MSINDFINKIKGYTPIDRLTVMYLSILVVVGISAFGLGRISITKSSLTANVISSSENQPMCSLLNIAKPAAILNESLVNQVEGKYLASKNGKLYYTVGCSGAKRISTKNIVWFNTQADAEKEGYKFSPTCNK